MDLNAESVYQTPFVNSTLFSMLLLSLANQRHTPKTAAAFYREYDYVIVGAGSAGSVLAARLSEIPCVTVLLLEAGKAPPLISEVPGSNEGLLSSDIDWDYRTAPQKYTAEALVNRQVVWPSGKAIGGSSVLSGLKAVRGNRKNYDDWAAQGAKGWSYNDVLPYFIKLEDNRDPEYIVNGYHGVGGPLTTKKPSYNPEIKGPLLKAACELGYSIVDVNAREQIGFYDLQANLRNSQHCTPAKAYLVPSENRTNLDILPNAFVTKVLISNRTATGVQFEYLGSTHEVKAKREVIVSAGTINTAQLLKLSGIGPQKELDRFQIPVIADLPVGDNLQDHCAVRTLFTLNPSIQPAREKLTDPQNIMQYVVDRSGPLASSLLGPVIAFLQNENSTRNEKVPDFELYFTEIEIGSGFQRSRGFTPEVIEEVFAPYQGLQAYFCASQILNPRSRGTVTLQSTNPHDPPIIDPNYFYDPKDIEDVVEGLKVCMKIGRSAPMQRIGSTLMTTLFPSCAQYEEDEDSYLWCYARQFVVTYSHPVGTAKMGDPNDPSTVVDSRLRVKTVKSLRIVDASVMPIIPSGNTNVPTIMIAEKASDIIKRSIHCDANQPQE